MTNHDSWAGETIISECGIWHKAHLLEGLKDPRCNVVIKGSFKNKTYSPGCLNLNYITILNSLTRAYTILEELRLFNVFRRW